MVLPRVSLHSTITHYVTIVFRLSHQHLSAASSFSRSRCHYACALLSNCKDNWNSKSIRRSFYMTVYVLCCQVPTHFRHKFGVKHYFRCSVSFIYNINRFKNSFSILEIFIIYSRLNP